MPVPLRTTYQKAEAKYNVTTEFPSLGLHSAAATGNVGLVEYALEHGQPINSVLDGVLPLHAACAGGNVQVVKVLIDHGADVNAPRLPRRYSNDKNRDASAPIVGTSGSTPLHFAAANGNTDAVTLLLLHGAHADRSDKHGVTPETLARQNGWLECAGVLQQWVLNKDKDLRERPSGFADDFKGLSRERLSSFGTDASEPSLTMRRRLQMKHSIDTALNRLRSSSVDPKQQSTSSTPPSSPFKGEYTFYPVVDSDDERLALFDGARRPSLPQILHPSTSGPSRMQKSSPSHSSGSPSPRRPRSAGTGTSTEPEDLDLNPPPGRPSVGRRLGSKYSLLNIFKRAQSSEYGQPVESSQYIPHPSPPHTPGSVPAHSLTNSSHPTSSPQHSSAINLSDHSTSSSPSPFTRSALRFHRGSDASTRAASQPQTPPSSNGSGMSTGTIPSPQHPTIPLGTDIHNGLTQPERQRHSHSRDRSRSAASGILRTRGHTRDRSGSGGSLAGSPGYRGGTVFDDDVMVVSGENNDGGKSESRPSILLAHRRLSSSGQGFRALRLDSTSGSNSAGRSGKEGETDVDGRGLLLRFSNSITSLSEFKRRVPSSPALRVSEEDLAPESVSAVAGDLVAPPSDDLQREAAYEDEDEDFEYGRQLPRDHQPLLDIGILEKSSQIGVSIATSSESSLSPIISKESPTVEGSPLVDADFPFSINRPPPTLPSENEPDPSSSALLRIPSPIDSRSRGDSVSSTSTADSYNPQLSMSGTTSGSGGSDTVTTPVLATTGVVHIHSSPKRNEERLVMEGLQEGGLSISNVKNGNTTATIGIPVRHERRHRIPPDISISSISSHAQAEALVHKAQQDILEMALDSDTSSATGSTGRSPLSARLAAYGESLALERRLREQKAAEDDRSASTDRQQLDLPLLTSDTSILDGRITPRIDSLARRDGVERHNSVEHKSGRPRLNARVIAPRRPSTAEGLSPRQTNNSMSSDQSGRSHQSSRSTSGFTSSPSSKLSAEQDIGPAERHNFFPEHYHSNRPSFERDVDLAETHDFFPDHSHSSTVNHDQNIISGYNRNGRHAFTPLPLLDLENGQLSRISSLETPETDTELGSPLYRVSTAPLSGDPSLRGKREVKTANKLTRMGFSPAEQAGRGHLTVSGSSSKRFGAFKSLIQTIKGK